MKKYLLGAAAILAIAAPGVARADNGSIGFTYENNDSSFFSDTANYYGLNLNYMHNTDSGFAVQGEAQSDRIDVGGGHAGLGYVAASIGTKSDSYSFYGFLGHTDLFYLGDAFDIGAGASMYGSSYSLNGSVSYGDFDNFAITDVSVDGTWFLSDNFGINGQAAWEKFSDGGPDVTTYGVGLDWRFSGSPIDLNVGYQRASGDADGDIFRIGFAYQFGSASLREASQSHWNGAQRQFEDLKAVF